MDGDGIRSQQIGQCGLAMSNRLPRAGGALCRLLSVGGCEASLVDVSSETMVE